MCKCCQQVLYDFLIIIILYHNYAFNAISKMRIGIYSFETSPKQMIVDKIREIKNRNIKLIN